MLIKTKDLREATINASLSTIKEKDSILHNIKIETKNNKLTVLSQNNVTKLIQTIETQEQENLNFVIDPQKLINILKEIKENEVKLKQEDSVLIIKSGNFSTKIKTLNAKSYPELKEPETDQPICSLEAEKIKKLIKETIYCPDKNDIAREYTGVYFEFEENKIKATATDHYRLINVTTEASPNEQVNFILENGGASLINRIPIEGTTDLYLANGEFVSKAQNLIITSKLINGSFPDYNQILLNKETSNTIELNKEEFKDSIKRSSVLSENREIMLKIELESKTLTLSSQNQEGEIAEDKLNFEIVKAERDLTIKLDSKFLLDFLNQITSETITFIYRSAEEPVQMESEEEGYSYKYIMTPIIE